MVSALFLALDVAEVVFISRLFLKALLETRNDVLSRSIRVACEESARSGEGGGVVAVLGAAHLNGVQLRLMGDGDDEWWGAGGGGKRGGRRRGRRRAARRRLDDLTPANPESSSGVAIKSYHTHRARRRRARWRTRVCAASS